MDKPKTLHPRYLSQGGAQIADRLRLGDSIRAPSPACWAATPARSAARSSATNPESGGWRALPRPAEGRGPAQTPKPRMWDEIAAGLRRHWSPEQIANRLLDFPDNGDMHASETIYQAIYLQARGELKQS